MKVTADDIAQLLASAPPRLVPAHVAQAARRGSASRGTAVFGLVFGAFGMIFVAIFFPWQFWNDWRLAAGMTHTTTGEVTAVNSAHMSVNKQRVMEYRFTFVADAGARVSAACFSTDGGKMAGQRVNVRYLVADPAVACIEGMRLSKAGTMGVIVLIFPGLGFGFAGWFLLQRRRTDRLLHEGLVAEADVISVEETNTTVNNRRLYKIVLSSPAFGAQPVTVLRLNAADIGLAGRHLEKKQPIFVLYDPGRPSRLVFPEALLDAEG